MGNPTSLILRFILITAGEYSKARQLNNSLFHELFPIYSTFPERSFPDCAAFNSALLKRLTQSHNSFRIKQQYSSQNSRTVGNNYSRKVNSLSFLRFLRPFSVTSLYFYLFFLFFCFFVLLNSAFFYFVTIRVTYNLDNTTTEIESCQVSSHHQ